MTPAGYESNANSRKAKTERERERERGREMSKRNTTTITTHRKTIEQIQIQSTHNHRPSVERYIRSPIVVCFPIPNLADARQRSAGGSSCCHCRRSCGAVCSGCLAVASAAAHCHFGSFGSDACAARTAAAASVVNIETVNAAANRCRHGRDSDATVVLTESDHH